MLVKLVKKLVVKRNDSKNMKRNRFKKQQRKTYRMAAATLFGQQKCVIFTCWKVLRDARIDPPIHTRYISGHPVPPH